MALSLIARTSARQAFTRGRSLHTTAPLRDAHGHYHVRTFPAEYGRTLRRSLAFSVCFPYQGQQRNVRCET